VFGRKSRGNTRFQRHFSTIVSIAPFETKSLLELEKQFICVDAMMTVVALSFIFLPIGIVLIIIIALLVVRAFRSESRQPLDTQQQVVGEKMAKKEVIVKVRCSYCGNQFDETLDKCPYCGAKH